MKTVAVLASVALLLSGCSGDDGDADAPVVQLGGPSGSNRTLSPDEVDELDQTSPHTPADVAFAQNMIPHHQQALVMIALVPNGAGHGLPLLAERMAIGQRDEIGQLEEWLASRDEELPGSHHDHDPSAMPGMLSDAELARLESSRGERFERLFLQFMIRHHEGALLMVQGLHDGGGGQEPGLFQLVQHIDADQRVEIARMRSLLAGM
ncbi:MAG TPA: DUF305 domain-containing protein [Nocardioidaceae bacterium]|nr:DUF305 domain-containing protein [Nocardioidaceae bacterium]